MVYHSVHMRDQKANQMAMLAKTDRQAVVNMIEEITLVVVLWGVFFLATLS
ncbi:MAG: hypothetical protein ACXV7J_03575 [Methylomonas sp.]